MSNNYKQLKKRKMELTCIKSVKTKNGNEFIKGDDYSYVIISKGIRVYYSSDKYITIKNEKTLNKYFI